MATYKVQKGDSWASIAGKIYGNQRFLVELMKANGGIYLLHPGMEVNTPDFDTSQNPTITGDEWGAVQAYDDYYGFNQPVVQQTAPLSAGQVENTEANTAGRWGQNTATGEFYTTAGGNPKLSPKTNKNTRSGQLPTTTTYRQSVTAPVNRGVTAAPARNLPTTYARAAGTQSRVSYNPRNFTQNVLNPVTGYRDITPSNTLRATNPPRTVGMGGGGSAVVGPQAAAGALAGQKVMAWVNNIVESIREWGTKGLMSEPYQPGYGGNGMGSIPRNSQTVKKMQKSGRSTVTGYTQAYQLPEPSVAYSAPSSWTSGVYYGGGGGRSYTPINTGGGGGYGGYPVSSYAGRQADIPGAYGLIHWRF